MKELRIKLTNSFGIGKLDHKFYLSEDDNVIMIYAPNGTMKTSLARSFLSIEENHKPEDLVINSRNTLCSITFDGIDILPEQIYVYKNKEIQIAQEGISRITEDNIIPLITSPQKYYEFSKLLKPLDKQMEIINVKFESFLRGKALNFSREILKVYKKEGVLDIQESLIELYEASKEFKEEIPDSICYDDLFDENNISIKYINNNIDFLLGNKKQRKPAKGENGVRWKRICDIVNNNQHIRSKLRNVESLRKDFLCHFVKKHFFVFEVYVNSYKCIRSKLFEIISDINKESPLWNEVISTFNSRFNVPYKIKIVNKSEVVLKHDSFIQLDYDYDDGEEKGQYYSEDHFLNFISSGEKRAYYLLLNLFGIEKRKYMPEKSVIVFDDIVESFDYKNKYAFVEYLADLKKEKNFVIILLTHNFDFFRTVHSRLNVTNVFMAEKNESRYVSIHPALYLHDIIKNLLIKNCAIPKYLISLVPFVRNIVEYTKGSESEEFKKLTSFVHVMNDIDELTLKDLFLIISHNIDVEKGIQLEMDGNYFQTLILEAEKAYSSSDDIALENKLVLSIAIRIMAEKFMLRELHKNEITCNYNNNQTFNLFDRYKNTFMDNLNELRILRRVIMMTSENIHLNNFMFEPIIDLSTSYLKELFISVKSLCNSSYLQSIDEN